MSTTLPETPSPDDTSIDTNTTRAESVIHAVKFRTLVEETVLYELAEKTTAQLDSERGVPANKDCPHRVGVISPSWVGSGETFDVGLFASGTWYGEENEDGDVEQANKYHLALYSDISRGVLANTSSKHSLTFDRHDTSLMTVGGGDVPPVHGVDGETYHEGTMVKISSSYCQTPTDALDRTAELINAVCDGGWIQHWRPREDTFTFTDMEAYVRYERRRLNAVIETLSTSSKLLASKAQVGSVDGEITKGHWRLYRFRADPGFHELGFATDEEAVVEGESIKTYLALNANQYSAGDPLYHPKAEVCVHGRNHVSRWNSVREHADDILFSHIDWAGVGPDEYVSDAHFVAPDDEAYVGNGTTFYQPSQMRAWIQEYYKRDDVHNALVSQLHTGSEAHYDILLCLEYAYDQQATYQQIADTTGFSKRTIRRRVGDLCKDRVLRRVRGQQTFVEYACEAAKDLTQRVIEKGKTVKEHLQSLSSRRTEREERRQQAAEDAVEQSPDPEDAMHEWVPLSETPLTVRDLSFERAENIYVRRSDR
jgi:hypothetical protein